MFAKFEQSRQSVPARKQRQHSESVKERIKISQLINRLQSHAISAKPLMDASQVKAAQILLLKVVPDLKAHEHSGPGGGPIEFASKEQRDAAIAAAQRAHK